MITRSPLQKSFVLDYMKPSIYGSYTILNDVAPKAIEEINGACRKGGCVGCVEDQCGTRDCTNQPESESFAVLMEPINQTRSRI